MGRRISARWLGTAILVVPLALIAPASGAAQAEDPGRGDLELVPGAVTPSGRVEADKAPTSSLAESDRKLLRRTDAKPVRVMIKLDYDSTATYQGGVDGLSATSPSVTGRQLTGKSTSERRYEAYVAGEERSIKADISAAVSRGHVRPLPPSRLRRRVGRAARQPGEGRREVDGVVAVQRNDAASSRSPTRAPTSSTRPPSTTSSAPPPNAGEGVIYGNLDTGIWPEHPSFADHGNLAAPPGPARECNYGDNPLTPAADVFVCQNKLIGGVALHRRLRRRPERHDDPYAGTARDGDGHGTHTASTSAGNIVDARRRCSASTAARSTASPRVPGSIEYKVCGPRGCFELRLRRRRRRRRSSTASTSSTSRSPAAPQPFTDPVELAFLDAYAAGVFVVGVGRQRRARARAPPTTSRRGPRGRARRPRPASSPPR